MRYNVHQSRNKIGRFLGVLIGAALVATLGLPGAAQAQTPAAPTVTGTGNGMVDSDGTLTVSWGQPLGTASGQDQWLLEYTEPGVAWDDAKKVVIEESTTMNSDALPANDPRIHHGVWRFRVSYYDADLDPDNDIDDVTPVVIGTPSATTDYHHGPPTAAPMGLTAYNAGPDARRIVWNEIAGLTYQLRYTPDPPADAEWTAWTE